MIYNKPALDAVNGELTVYTKPDISSELVPLSSYSKPSLSAVDGALTVYTKPVYHGIVTELALTAVEITPSVGSLAVTGNQPNVVKSGGINYDCTPTTGSTAVTGIQSIPSRSSVIIPTVGSITTVSIQPVVVRSSIVTPTVGSIAVAGVQTVVGRSSTITPSTGSVGTVGVQSQSSTGVTISPVSASLSVATNITIISGALGNGDFESPLSGTWVSTSGTIVWDSSEFHSGSRSVKLSRVDAGIANLSKV